MEQPKKRSKQIQKGIKINSASTGISFVFTSGWPSWSLELDSLGHRTIFTHIEDGSMSAQGILEAEAVVGKNQMLQEKEMLQQIDQCAEQQDKNFRVFVQGSFDYIERIREALPKKADDRICVAGIDQIKRFQRSQCNKFSLGHSEVGGVVNENWKFGHLVDLTNLSELLFRSPVHSGLSVRLH